MTDYRRTWFDVEREGLRAELRQYMRQLSADLGSAGNSLDSGDRINQTFMQHAAAISTMIGRWNLLREIQPMIWHGDTDTKGDAE